MARHVFLTGEKQVGKSTLVKKILNEFQGSIGGFFTVKTDAFVQEGCSVHLFSIGDEPTPNENNLLFICGSPDMHISERFNVLGCSALSQHSNCSLIVMDELGPHEVKADLFCQTVLQLLDGDTPVFGVLQAPAELFWPDVTNHPDVRVVDVTECNRDDTSIIDDILSDLTDASSQLQT